MKVGLFINTQFPEGDSVAARIPELVEQVRVARDAGFASVLFPHHYLTAPLQMLQITPLMAYLLPEARGMTIGGNILLLPLLNPVHVAEESATLDVLSGGKFILGVGLGYRPGEFAAFGTNRRRLVDRQRHHTRCHRTADAGLPRGVARGWPNRAGISDRPRMLR